MTTWTCTVCSARAESRTGWCPRCGGINTFAPQVWSPASEVLADTATVTARELHRVHTRFLNLGEDLERTFGRLPLAAFILALFGPPGSLKSTTFLRLADRLCAIWGPVLLASLEEGFAPTLSERLRRLEIFRDDLVFSASSDLATLLSTAANMRAKALFIDSLTESALDADDVARVVRETGLAVGYTMHGTKAGDAAGKLGLIHVADVVIKLEDGRFHRTKSRYSPTSEGSL